MNPTHFVAGLHIAQGQEVDACSVLGVTECAVAILMIEVGGVDLVEAGPDEQLFFEVDAPCFDKERKRETGGGFDLGEFVETSAGKAHAIGSALFALGSDLEEVAFFGLGFCVGGIEGFDGVFEFDRVRSGRAFLIGDAEGDQGGCLGRYTVWEDTAQKEIAKDKVREDAAEDDQTEQHPKDEVKQVVARVDSSEAKAKGESDEPAALAGKREFAWEAHTAFGADLLPEGAQDVGGGCRRWGGRLGGRRVMRGEFGGGRIRGGGAQGRCGGGCVFRHENLLGFRVLWGD